MLFGMTARDILSPSRHPEKPSLLKYALLVPIFEHYSVSVLECAYKNVPTFPPPDTGSSFLSVLENIVSLAGQLF